MKCSDSRALRLVVFTAALALVSCERTGKAPASGDSTAALQRGGLEPSVLQRSVKNVVIIYAENRSFDNLFGKFPGANGLSTVLDANGKPTPAYVRQKDRDGSTVLRTLPPTWNGVTPPGVKPVVTAAQSAGLPNRPFAIETAFKASANATLTTSTVTRDLWHRFFENQMQIDGGKNDGFAAWSDAGGLAMGHFDYTNSAMFKLAQEFVLADNFFQGAFGLVFAVGSTGSITAINAETGKSMWTHTLTPDPAHTTARLTVP